MHDVTFALVVSFVPMTYIKKTTFVKEKVKLHFTLVII